MTAFRICPLLRYLRMYRSSSHARIEALQVHHVCAESGAATGRQVGQVPPRPGAHSAAPSWCSAIRRAVHRQPRRAIHCFATGPIRPSRAGPRLSRRGTPRPPPPSPRARPCRRPMGGQRKRQVLPARDLKQPDKSHPLPSVVGLGRGLPFGGQIPPCSLVFPLKPPAQTPGASFVRPQGLRPLHAPRSRSAHPRHQVRHPRRSAPVRFRHLHKSRRKASDRPRILGTSPVLDQFRE